MTSLSVVGRDARLPATFPMFTQLPPEVRLLIYAFVFMGCRATVWLDGEFGDYMETWQGRRRMVCFKDGQCCYEHFGEGFRLLASCRTLYNEASATYWEKTILKVSRNVFPRNASCELQKVCAYLPADIKDNLRHLRNTKLPILGRVRPTEGDSNWTPTLLMQFPKLQSCEFRGGPPLAGGLKNGYSLRVPDSLNFSLYYDGVGPFHVTGGVSPAVFIERRLGVKKQNRPVMILSKASGEVPVVRPPGYKPRVSPIPACVPYGIGYADRLVISPETILQLYHRKGLSDY